MGLPLPQGADQGLGTTGRGGGPGSPPSVPPPRQGRRLGRVLRWGGAVLGAGVLLVAATLLVVPLWVESESGRRFIVDAAREQGVELAYDGLTLRPFSGRILWENLRLAMPAPHAHVADHWLAIRRIELLWSPAALLTGRLHVERLGIEGVRVHVVVDEEGEDSFSLFLRGLPEDPEPDEDPPVPLSHTLADLDLGLPVRVETLAIQDVQAQLTELLGDARSRRSTLDGLELTAWLRLDGGPLEAEVTEGSTDRPEGTRLVVTDVSEDGEATRELHLRLSNHVTVREGRTVTHLATVDVLHQTFDDELTLTGEVLAAETQVDFMPEQRATRFALTRFTLLDDVATANLALEVRDDEALPRLEGGSGTLHVDPLVRLLPARLGAFVSEGVRADFRVEPPKGGAAGEAQLQVRGRAERLGATVDDTEASLNGGSLDLDATVSPDRVEASMQAALERFVATTPDAAAEVGPVRLTLDARDVRFAGDDPVTVTGQVDTALHLGTIRAQTDGDAIHTEEAQLEASVALAPDGTLAPSLRLALGDTRASLGSGTRLQVAPFQLEVTATDVTPELDRLVRFEGRGGTARVQADTGPGERTVAEDVGLTLDGHYTDGGTFTVRVGTTVASVLARSADGTTRARDAQLKLSVQDVDLHEEDPLQSTANVSLTAGAGSVELRDDALAWTVDAPTASLEGRYRGRRPSNFSGTLGTDGVRLARDGRVTRALSKGELTWAVKDLVLDEDDPLRSQVRLEATGRFAPVALDLEAELAEGDGEASLHVRVESFAPFRGLLDSSGMAELDLAGSGMEVHGRGRWRGLDSDAPEMDHHLETSLSKVGYHEPDLDVRVPRIHLVLDHRGRALDHHATLRAEVARPEVNHQALDGSVVLTAKADVDGAKGTGHLETTLGGVEGLDVRATVDAVLSLDGRVEHTDRITVAKLWGLAPLIPPELREVHPVDLRTLAMEVDGRGTVHGLLDSPPEGASAGTAFHQSLTGTLRGIHYTPEGLDIQIPETRLELVADGGGPELTAKAKLHVPRIEAEDPAHHHVTLHDLRQEVHLTTTGEGEGARTTVELTGGIHHVDQDLSPTYPMEDLAVDARLVLDGIESVELERFVLENRRGGTTLELQKSLSRANGVDAGATRGVALRGKLTQVLDRLDGDPSTLVARGRLVAPFTVDSGDGVLFRIQAALELEDVYAKLPEEDLIVEGLNAKIPMEEAVEWTAEEGLVVVPTTDRNVFARVRFQDVQPFLSGDSHVELRRFHWNEVEVGPVMGSMRVEGNVFSVDKMKIHKGDALISGQLVVDYLPGSERIKFRGNVTGLKPRGSNDPLDANAAVVFDPRRLELDGRIQIVRVSRKHLLSLIDLVDPFREDPSMNSLRGGLKYGYPKQVRISMGQGLMSMKVDLGGIIGGLIKLGEIQGVPLGPFLNQHVAPYLPW